MADYSYVPGRMTSSAVYTDGEIVLSRTYIGDYRIGYAGSEDHQIRYTFVNDGVSSLSIYLLANGTDRNTSVYLVGPTGTVLETVRTTNFMYSDADKGYQAYVTLGFEYDRGEMTTSTTVFDNGYDAGQAMKFNETPSSESGVVVTVMASPQYVPPVTDGVVVNLIARLLDPNDQGGTSDPGGGQGTFDETSDVIPLPALPTVSAVGSGMVTLFRPSMEQVNALGAYLWTHLNDFWENLQKMFSKPADFIISFNVFPVVPDVGEDKNIYIGNWGTDISMPPLTSQWYEVNCGTITVPQYWGSALDFSPYTKIQAMLPFIGSVQLNPDEIMGQRLGLVYRIDMLSGTCVAIITVNNSVYYQFTGECSVPIPLSGTDWSRIYSAIAGAIGTAITGGVGAAHTQVGTGATAALAGARASEAISYAGQSFAMLNESSKGVRGVQEMRNRMLEAANTASNAAQQAASAAGQVSAGNRASRIANTVTNTIGAVTSGKVSIQHSGTISGSASMLGVRIPYLIIEFPNQSLAENYKHFVGYPSNMLAKIGDLSGYTECEQVIPEGFTGTDEELGELLEILKGGVYL